MLLYSILQYRKSPLNDIRIRDVSIHNLSPVFGLVVSIITCACSCIEGLLATWVLLLCMHIIKLIMGPWLQQMVHHQKDINHKICTIVFYNQN